MMLSINTGKMMGILRCIGFLLMLAGNLNAQQLQEKIFVHTDKNYYHAGEIIWFKLYVMDAASGKPNDLSKVAYVDVLDSAGRPLLQGIIELKKGSGNGSLIIPETQPGVYRLRAYTNWMKNFSPSQFFNKNIAIVNAKVSGQAYLLNDNPEKVKPAQPVINIELLPDRQVYGKREHVTIKLHQDTVDADLSVSVYRIDSFTRLDKVTIDTYSVPLTQAKAEVVFLPEVTGRIISGKVVNKNNGMPAKGINVYLSVPGYASGFYNCVSNSSGDIRFVVNQLVPTDYLIVQTDIPRDNVHTIQMHSPFYEGTPMLQQPDYTVVSSSAGGVLVEQSINAQVENLFNPEKRTVYHPFFSDTVPFFGNADLSYQLDDFTRFSKMEEVFREYIAPVSVIKKNNQFQLSVYNMGQHSTFPRPPLVLLDGYPVLDINRLFLFDPLKVKLVEVVNSKYIKGSYSFDGIVNMITYSHNLNGYEPDSHAVILKEHVIQRKRKFSFPSYASDDDIKKRLPDFRNVLYWTPSFDIDHADKREISFYTSDLHGRFVAVLQGITADGKPVSGYCTFEVRE